MTDLRTVTFENEAFNTHQPRPYFINPGCFGDDVLEWLAKALAARGVKVVGKPGQEDFGWYLRFEFDGNEYCFVLGYRPGDSINSHQQGEQRGLWIGTLERSRNLLGSILGFRRLGIERSAVELLGAVLSQMPGTTNLQWHNERDFRRGIEDRGVPNREA